jgi:hopene-associated glycosyltransferase HpnB
MEPGLVAGSLLALPGLLIWIIILLLPWRPWSTRESLDAEIPETPADLSRITVLVPARNEAEVISRTLDGLAAQGKNLRIILIDDQSGDETAAIAKQKNLPCLEIVNGQPLPEGWSGKLWALEQGRKQVNTELVLLLDADIELRPGMLSTLLNKLDRDKLDMLSLMAHLRMQNHWEKLLMPAFIFFFKLLYPFHLSNSGSPQVAAAAGGCILVKTAMLEKTGAFASLRQSLIDDCTLARKVRDCGGKIWAGLTHSAISLRPYNNPGVIRDMVARCAFTQLHYSWLLLILCTLLMTAAFMLPVIAVFSGNFWTTLAGLLALLIMYICYLPTLIYYRINPLWGICMPVTGALYLYMTWTSAWQYLCKSGSRWKNRSYSMTAQK